MMRSARAFGAHVIDAPSALDRDDVAKARDRLAGWIVDGGLQLNAGPHAGGVAGRLDAHGAPQYVYPEITGYFLQWLASRQSRGAGIADAALRAGKAQRWLRAWLAIEPVAPTRVYLHGVSDDWRNDAHFAFDHAMVLRGLAAAAEQRLLEPDPVVVRGVCTNLIGLIGSDGLLQACVPHQATSAMPDRWSTHRGPFLAKAARGILTAARTLQVPERLHAAAAATCAASLDWALASAHDYTHAFLYTIEGLLGESRDEIPGEVMHALVHQFADLLERTRTIDFVPESRTSVAVRRLDIVAQAVRVMFVLRARGQMLPGQRGTLDMLVGILVAGVSENGGVPFDLRSDPPQYGAWAALFTEQALAWAESFPRDESGISRDAYLV